MASSWRFITNHALVLVYVAMHPESTVREISSGIGLTERAALAILRELDEQGIVDRNREGRRNTYTLNFAALISYRRATTADLTPPAFVEAVVRKLAVLARADSIGVPTEGAAPIRTGAWGFFTNHLLMMLAIAGQPDSTVRDLAARTRLTERAAVTILKQLETERIVAKERSGRRNRYEIDYDAFERRIALSGGEWQLPAELVTSASGALRMVASIGAPAARAGIEAEPALV